MSCTFFLFNAHRSDTIKTIESALQQEAIARIVVFQNNNISHDQCIDDIATDKIEVVATNSVSFGSSASLKAVADYESKYNLIYTKTSPLKMGYRCAERMIQAIQSVPHSMVYSDYYETIGGETRPHPTIEYQKGSLRNDFNFGSLILINEVSAGRDLQYAGLYKSVLECWSHVHIPEFLYTEEESDTRKSGEKQFDYVNPAMRQVQIEMEQVEKEYCCHHGFLLSTDMIKNANLDVDFQREASVIIPVRNREKTIADAIRSALNQNTTFEYNVIVVDNHSTDGTSQQIEEVCKEDNRVVHLIPKQTDLGIGGCWDLAIRSEHCGKFAIQLDSDDLYSTPSTLQKIVDKFDETSAAMVIGSYSLVDFDLNPLPPGLIDHREWTDENGMNNALRINGLGAPRAFFVPVLRKIGFPNTSYGEDYAVGLAVSRQYKIGRIYENLYLCRRWSGNSDASLSVEKENKNNYYKDWIRTIEIEYRQNLTSGCCDQFTLNYNIGKQMNCWPEVAKRFEELDIKLQRKTFTTDNGVVLEAQFNPARIVSTGAKVDKESIAKRKCFLCEDNQPAEQLHFNHHGSYQICVNPFPILHNHVTIPLMAHKPQLIATHLDEFDNLIENLQGSVVFYNGAKCGASAPDHFHFQAGAKGEIPLQRDFDNYAKEATQVADDIYIVTNFAYPFFFTHHTDGIQAIIDALPKTEGEAEPRFNLIGWIEDSPLQKIYVIIPRKKQRPNCYFAEGDSNYCISPGAIDMGGLIITPLEKDFARLTAEKITDILCEVTLSNEELKPVIEKLTSIR